MAASASESRRRWLMTRTCAVLFCREGGGHSPSQQHHRRACLLCQRPARSSKVDASISAQKQRARKRIDQCRQTRCEHQKQYDDFLQNQHCCKALHAHDGDDTLSTAAADGSEPAQDGRRSPCRQPSQQHAQGCCGERVVKEEHRRSARAQPAALARAAFSQPPKGVLRCPSCHRSPMGSQQSPRRREAAQRRRQRRPAKLAFQPAT